MTATIEARVARGAALLDRTLAGWDDRIDLDRLDLENTCGCILGQEFAKHPDVGDLDDSDDDWTLISPFDIGVRELFAYEEDSAEDAAREHGFNAVSKPGHAAEEFRALTAEWKRVIEARRSAS